MSNNELKKGESLQQLIDEQNTLIASQDLRIKELEAQVERLRGALSVLAH